MNVAVEKCFHRDEEIGKDSKNNFLSKCCIVYTLVTSVYYLTPYCLVYYMLLIILGASIYRTVLVQTIN